MSTSARRVSTLAIAAVSLALLLVDRGAPRIAGLPPDGEPTRVTIPKEAERRTEVEGLPSGTMTESDPPLPSLERADVYRAIAHSNDMESAKRTTDAFRRALGLGGFAGGKGLALVEGDLEDAIEADDSDLVRGSAFVIAEASSGAEPELDDPRLLTWIDAIAISEAAAGAIADVFHHARRFADIHAVRTIALIRGGLPADARRAAARALLLLHAELHLDPTLFLPLLEADLAFLRLVGAEALLRIDSLGYTKAILDMASGRSDEERTLIVSAMVAVLPPEVAAEQLRALHRRWPDARLTEPWLVIGYLDGEALIGAYRVEEDASVRRRMLIGWHPEGLGSREAERFLTEVIDTDPDRSVRAQALIALGQIDDPAARARLAEAMEENARLEPRDPLWDAHIAAAVRNAIPMAPSPWIDRVALPFARQRIAESRLPDRERATWAEVIGRRHPERIAALD